MYKYNLQYTYVYIYIYVYIHTYVHMMIHASRCPSPDMPWSSSTASVRPMKQALAGGRLLITIGLRYSDIVDNNGIIMDVNGVIMGL